MHPAGNATVAGRCAALVEGSVEHHNNVRLNSAIGYITPKDMLVGRQQEIPRRQGSEAGGGEATTADSSPVGRVKSQDASLRAVPRDGMKWITSGWPTARKYYRSRSREP